MTVSVTLTLLLFGSGIVFCIVLCVYRHKKYIMKFNINVANSFVLALEKMQTLNF